MSERKVLNKYIPADFDPSKIGRIRKKKGPGNELVKVRLMAPYSMRCNTCGDFIYKGKKFNAKKEKLNGEDYLGIQVYRFYIRCPSCANEIVFKTDPKGGDYTAEKGATRNFEPWKNKEAEEIAADQAHEEELDPMKAVENKMLQSKKEMELLDELIELKSIKDTSNMLSVDDIQRAIGAGANGSGSGNVDNNNEVVDGKEPAPEDDEDIDPIQAEADHMLQEILNCTAKTNKVSDTTTKKGTIVNSADDDNPKTSSSNIGGRTSSILGPRQSTSQSTSSAKGKKVSLFGTSSSFLSPLSKSKSSLFDNGKFSLKRKSDANGNGSGKTGKKAKANPLGIVKKKKAV